MNVPCKYCPGECIRKGKRGHLQLYRCKAYEKYQRAAYQNKACEPGADVRIAVYVKEGCGIRSIARIMGISSCTVIARIKRIADRLKRPHALVSGRRYEMDELATFCHRKADRVWIAYAIDRTNRGVADLVIGARTKRNLGKVIDTVLLTGEQNGSVADQ